MSQPFTFPPPPPPPPKREPSVTTYGPSYTQQSRGSGRGRGGNRGGNWQRGTGQGARGRGFTGGSSFGRARYANTTTWNCNNVATSNVPVENAQAYAPIGSQTHISKRNHSTAFSNSHSVSGRPKAPPAIPSFNADLDNLLKKSESEVVNKSLPQRRSNLLGLTPSAQIEESESEGEDDEAKLTSAAPSAELTFEHKGKVMSLKTPEEIAAYIAERRKNFPTKAKVEIARKEAEEKKRKWEEQKKMKEEAARQARAIRDKERLEREKQKVKQKLLAQVTARAKAAVANNKVDSADEVRKKAERLRKRAQKAALELKQAEEALDRVEKGYQQVTETTELIDRDDTLPLARPDSRNQDGFLDMEEGGEDSTGSDINSELGDTSSSGSSVSESDVDSDSAPEIESSKRDFIEDGEDQPAPKLGVKLSGEEPRICRNYVKFGRCKFGRRCHYSHKVPKNDKKSKSIIQSTTASRRKGLYQIMADKEQEEEERRVLNVIISLGERGLLNDATEHGSQDGPPI